MNAKVDGLICAVMRHRGSMGSLKGSPPPPTKLSMRYRGEGQYIASIDAKRVIKVERTPLGWRVVVGPDDGCADLAVLNLSELGLFNDAVRTMVKEPA